MDHKWSGSRPRIGYGSEKPIVEEDADDDKHINRRVEFEMIDPDKKEQF